MEENKKEQNFLGHAAPSATGARGECSSPKRPAHVPAPAAKCKSRACTRASRYAPHPLWLPANAIIPVDDIVTTLVGPKLKNRVGLIRGGWIWRTNPGLNSRSNWTCSSGSPVMDAVQCGLVDPIHFTGSVTVMGLLRPWAIKLFRAQLDLISDPNRKIRANNEYSKVGLTKFIW